MQKFEKPKISVVLPTWNHAKLLPNAINSILNQSFKEWELIIIDDGSTDETEQVVRRFQDSRIRYTKVVHHGLVSARNCGNLQARADIIVMQDSDDLSMPDRLAKIYSQMHNHDADVLYHGIYINMWDKQFDCIGRKYVPARAFNKWDLAKEQYIPGACAFKKRCWEKKPFRAETQFAFDWMMHLDWAFSGFVYRALDVGLYEYVRHENSASISFERTGQRAESIKKIAEIMQNEYKISLKVPENNTNTHVNSMSIRPLNKAV